MSSKTKIVKKNIQDGYSHPLVRDIETPIEQDHQSIIPTYQPFQPNNQHRISAKIARHVFCGPNSQREVALFINPFNQAVDDFPQIQEVPFCKLCNTKPCPLTSYQNHSTLHCHLCNQKTEISANSYNNQAFSFGYRIQQNLYNKQKDVCQNTKHRIEKMRNRQVCFFIQKSQQNYESGVHRNIISSLRAVSDQSLLVAFVLFDNRSFTFINEYLEVTKMVVFDNQSFDSWSALPIPENELFIQVSDKLDQLYEIINSLMYEAFYLNQTLIVEAVDMIDRFLLPPIEVKFFITTLNHLYDPHLNNCKNISFFKQKQNKIKEAIQKKFKLLDSNKSLEQKKPKNVSNAQFYIIPYKTTFRESIQLLKFGVAKIYDVKQQYSFQNQLYYDLFQSLTKEVYFNTEFIIRTPKSLQLNLLPNHADTLYDNLQVTTIRQNNLSKTNQYTIKVRQSTSSFLLPLKFKVKNTQSHTLGQKIIQIEYSNGRRSPQKVILNLLIKQTLQNKSQIESVDDEALFNFHLRRCLGTWDGESFPNLRELLNQEYTESVRQIMEDSGNGISFPKNWKHYLLYSFKLQEYLSQGKLNCYQLYRLLNKNLESFSKIMYFRTYKLEDRPKNIKCATNMFEKYQLVFLQDGERLYLVLNDISVQKTKQLFGYFDTIPSLARNHLQLPQIHSNLKYRQAISTIRASHGHTFLPLTIIDFQSSAFTEEIEPRLYQKSKHMDFLRKLWKNA